MNSCSDIVGKGSFLFMNFIAKPFVKWAGGKYKLANTIIDETKEIIDFSTFDTYVDPFVGAGGMFFSIVQNYDFKRLIISDINAELINTYRSIKDNLEELVILLNQIQNEFNLLESENEKKEYYLKLREDYNQKILNHELDLQQAAFFIALNKLGFNGLYRVNGKGFFNVPFGKKKTAKLYDYDNLVAVSKILQKAEIYCMDYQECLRFVNDKTLVYFDSPYRPLPGSSSFTSYAKSDFNDDNQRELFKTAKMVQELNGRFYLSNSDPTQVDENDTFFDDLYKEFVIKRVYTRRMIGATSAGRGMVSEILVIG